MRDPLEQLRRMRQAITKITQYAQKGRQRFDKEEEIQLSIIHYLQIIGDAAQTVSKDFKDLYPEISWQQMVSFQDFLTHYYEVNPEAVWKIAEHDLPNLKRKVDAVLEQAEKAGGHSNRAGSIASRQKLAKAIDELLQTKREDILRTAWKHGASNVRIFGSVARGEADGESDIDLLVDMAPGRTLFDIGELLIELQNLLGRQVDVVTEKSLNDHIRERVLHEAVPL